MVRAMFSVNPMNEDLERLTKAARDLAVAVKLGSAQSTILWYANKVLDIVDPLSAPARPDGQSSDSK